MALPVSPGEILELTKVIIKTYKKFRYAADEMDQLEREVRIVENLMKSMEDPKTQIEYLQKNPNGRELYVASWNGSHPLLIRKTKMY